LLVSDGSSYGDRVVTALVDLIGGNFRDSVKAATFLQRF
jgi:hypothetical protein